MSTPKSSDTLAVLAAFKDSPTLNEAVAQAFRALALLKSRRISYSASPTSWTREQRLISTHHHP